MAHAIEQFEDGTSAFFSNRVPAWHKLGEVTEGALTAEDALKIAQLDWRVYKATEPVTTTVLTDDGVATLPVEGKFATYRNHPKLGVQTLGIVGNQYEPVQNAEAFAFLSLLVDEHGAAFETAGSINDGKQVFISMKMPKDVLVGGEDMIESYVVCTTAHDGTGAFQVVVTPIRVVCQNTLNMALGRGGARQRYAMKHTRNVSSRVHQARETLGLTFRYMEAFEKKAEELIAQELSDKQFAAFAKKLVVPGRETERSASNAENRQRELMALWRADTQANIQGTRWAAYNTVAEWVDWARPVKGKDKDARRAMRTLSGKSDQMKQRALALL